MASKARKTAPTWAEIKAAEAAAIAAERADRVTKQQAADAAYVALVAKHYTVGPDPADKNP